MIKETVKEITQTVTKQITLYETEDGQQFDSKRSAERHERYQHARQQLASLKKVVVPEINDKFLPYGDAYYVNNVDEYELLVEHESTLFGACVLDKKYKGCGWYVSRLNDGGDHLDDLEFFHASTLILDRLSELKKFEEAFQTTESPQNIKK